MGNDNTIKHIIYVEANVMIIDAKFQLHPPWLLRNRFLIFFFFFGKFSLSVAMAIWTKFIWLAEDTPITFPKFSPSVVMATNQNQ